ncbi:MAG: MarR family winged helix-turn-helix transcriptional regulator [Bacillota bacterium]
MEYNNNFLHWFKQIGDMIEKNGNSKLNDFGLTLSQCHILAYLRHKEEFQASYKEIETISKVAQSSAASMISRLEARGFVKTFTAKTDKRIKLLELTEFGKSCVEATDKCMDELKNELFEKLTEGEKQTLFVLLSKITDNQLEGEIL